MIHLRRQSGHAVPVLPSLSVLVASALLVACSGESAPAVTGMVPERATVPESVELAPALSTLPPATIQVLMRDQIQPAATGLWTAVSFVVTEQGTQETMPTTDEDWNGLRDHADVLMQASATLQLPNLRVITDAIVTPDFQLTPEEIEQARMSDPAPWRSFVEEMRTSTLKILGAIERRDLVEYTQLGATLNEACEGCHARYWYRPLPMRGAEGLR